MKKRMRIIIVTVITFGFFCGVSIPEIFHMNQGSYAGLLSVYGLQGFEHSRPEPVALFYYVFRSRSAGLILLWMSCYTPIGTALHVLCLLWLSASFGILASVFLLRQGYQGILLLLCCILPQWVIYLSVLRQEFSFLIEKSRRSGSGSIVESNVGGRDLQGLGKMLLACLTGCILETWFGLYIFQLFLRYL